MFSLRNANAGKAALEERDGASRPTSCTQRCRPPSSSKLLQTTKMSRIALSREEPADVLLGPAFTHLQLILELVHCTHNCTMPAMKPFKRCGATCFAVRQPLPQSKRLGKQHL